MNLEIFVRATRTRVDMIRTYNFVQYEDEFNGMGSFSVKLPTNDESLLYLYEGNFIYFEEGVMGVIKGIRSSQDSDVEIEVYGYLTNYFLNTRVFDYTRKYYDTISNISRNMVKDFFINPGNEYRKMSAVTLSEDARYNPVFDEKITLQKTGDTIFQAISETFLTYNLGFELYPIIANYEEGKHVTNLAALEFRILKPTDRTINNEFGNTPVVFSFDLNNLASLEYEEDGRAYCSSVYVASEGEGEDRKVVEVGETKASGFYRIEGYTDARDLQTGSSTGSGSGGGNTGSGSGNTGTVLGGAFEVAKWYLVDDGGWIKDSELHWHSTIAASSIYSGIRTISFAINVPYDYTASMKLIATRYMAVEVVLNDQKLYEKGTTGAFDDLVSIPLKAGINNLRISRWVPEVSGNTSETKTVDVYLYDFVADITTDGYLTTTADIWRPNLDEEGIIDWSKSANVNPPASRNIKGPKGEQGISPHIDPETGTWFIGEVDTHVRADGIDGKDGEDGITPHIDTVTGHWFIGSTDTGVAAQGPQGIPGPPGEQGPPGSVAGLPFEFGIDKDDKYGYYKNDTGEFVPFGTGSGGGSGIFRFEIREDGHLWMLTDDPLMADKFYINDEGHLIYRLE